MEELLYRCGVMRAIRNVSDYRTAIRTNGSVYRFKFIFIWQEIPEGWEIFSLGGGKEDV